MNYKYKVIENDITGQFEQELNYFASQSNIEVIDIEYSAIGVSSINGYSLFHSALIKYFEIN